MLIPADDPRAIGAKAAIESGDVAALTALLADHPELATARVAHTDPNCGDTRTLLHVATDWPGHFPEGPATVATLVAAGADVNAHMESTRPVHRETPLHWAASTDDVAVLDALLDAGADIEADGAVIAGGTAMSDATAFANWDAARRLLARGARTNLWESAALGLTDRVEAHLAADPPPSAEDVTGAFWGACHGGHRPTAELLLAHGADPAWVGWDDLTPAAAAERNGFAEVAAWAGSLGRRRD
ncbi:MAG TPA: hypothetical protein VH479_02555 [Acidimicrobiales bacterium]|jgi:hypothetical protein